ncbi:hypothetical protein [Listeria riparia]|nr:hypothetical protein [Listeria riparia]
MPLLLAGRETPSLLKFHFTLAIALSSVTVTLTVFVMLEPS